MKLNTKYKVLTPQGFQNFAGVDIMGIKSTYRVTLENGIYVECTHDHKLFVNDVVRTPLSDIKINDTIITSDGEKRIISIEPTGKTEEVYDLIEVENGHRYYANGILSSNCKFISFEETLINPAKLAALDASLPVHTTGHVRWYKEIDPDKTYVIGLDPSMGTGGDDAAVQVYELPSLVQVGEWQHNKTQIEGQVRVLKQMCQYVESKGADDIYWSVESNSLGEAVLVVIRDTGEETFPGTFLHDHRRDLSIKMRRKGFITTHKSKLEACARLKSWIETGKLTVHSKNLIHQLKMFIAKGNSYEAKGGERDDLVMSTILTIRMAIAVSGFDDRAYSAINSNIEFSGVDDEGEYAAPMPIVMI